MFRGPAALTFPLTNTDWMAGWFELMTSLLPVYRFTLSCGLETAEWPGLVVVARRMKARITSIQDAFFNPPTTCLLCPYILYGQRSGAHSRQGRMGID